jgi:hypothetical protein
VIIFAATRFNVCSSKRTPFSFCVNFDVIRVDIKNERHRIRAHLNDSTAGKYFAKRHQHRFNFLAFPNMEGVIVFQRVKALDENHAGLFFAAR